MKEAFRNAYRLLRCHRRRSQWAPASLLTEVGTEIRESGDAWLVLCREPQSQRLVMAALHAHRQAA